MYKDVVRRTQERHHFQINIDNRSNMKLLLAILSTALAVRAHTIFQQIGINGQMAERHNYMRLPEYDGVSSLTMFCLIRTYR